ncbi:MAG TPA: hypothetical protein PLE45_11715 [Spirochaetota bacterium]|nr:hypothetical protein [Spirochaetota bacterium]HOL56773.1 hypothetical protein [Spirochaetota bacterium]HPP05463.1 hypothetical protein [Spirochaetota bacterium]
MNFFLRRIFIIICFNLNLYILYAKDIQLPYKIEKINIFFKVFLFYFPISKDYETNFFYDTETYSIEINIKKNHINNEPSTPSIFDTDLFFRIDNIYYNRYGDMDLTVIIRVNKKILTFNIPFKITKKDKFIYINGKIKDLKFKDITKDPYFSKRENVSLPFIFDLVITSKF